MDLICYLQPGWEPEIRPGQISREWMDNTPQAFAYRCLPLSIANAHGWEVPCPLTFEAFWTGRGGVEDVLIRIPPGGKRDPAPVSIFGNGVLTFHIYGLIRTPPGWNLWVGGAPNWWKQDIHPLSGIIETDWSPYSFTMNWRFTRPGSWIRFEQGEPICFFFPVPRGALEVMTPKYVPLKAVPELLEQFRAWSRSRDAFREEVEKNPPTAPSARWQKLYYRGVDMLDRSCPEHQAKLHLKAFVTENETSPPESMLPGIDSVVANPDERLRDIKIKTSPVVLGRALGAVMHALAKGGDPTTLATLLAPVGLGPNEAKWVIQAALEHRRPAE